MPKIKNTRKQRASELMRLLEVGPSLDLRHTMTASTDVERGVKLWLSSWIIPAVTDLVPELKAKQMLLRAKAKAAEDAGSAHE